MTFLEPLRLFLLLGVLGLVVAYVLMQRRRKRYAVRFAALPLLERVAPKGPGWRRHLPAAAYLVMAAALVTAFARPEMQTRVAREEATVVVALDVSASMQATDVSPDRLTVARDAARTFVEGLPQEYRVGLVTFSSSARIAVSPTIDHGLVDQALEDATLGGGTAIGDALVASVQSVESTSSGAGAPGSGGSGGSGSSAGSSAARIVLLSDGASASGVSVDQGVAAAMEAGIPVSTIAYGTADGVVTLRGQTIPVPADTQTLASIAQETGGKSYEAASADQLRQVYDDLGSSIGYRVERTEVTSWFVGLAILAALLAAGGSLLWFGRLP